MLPETMYYPYYALFYNYKHPHYHGISAIWHCQQQGPESLSISPVSETPAPSTPALQNSYSLVTIPSFHAMLMPHSKQGQTHSRMNLNHKCYINPFTIYYDPYIDWPCLCNNYS